MAIVTRIYAGPPGGGPVDYTTAIATVSGTTHEIAGLAAGEKRRYAVRSVDTETGLEEYGTQAQLTLERDAAGADVSTRPAGPVGVSATPARAGGVTVAWAYFPRPDRPDPDHFAVWVTAGDAVDTSVDPDAIVPFAAFTPHFSAAVAGLADATAYAAGVRGILGGADDGNAEVAKFTAAAGAPLDVRAPSATTTFREGD